MNSIPIIHLELQGMRHTLAVALSQYVLDLDSAVQQAIKDFCTEDNINGIVRNITFKTLDSIIKEEITRFFTYDHEGREIIAKAVREKILSNKTYTPLDEA